MNPFKFAVAAAVLLAGTQSVEAKSLASPLGGINALLDFHVEVDAASACDAAAAYSDGSITRGSASVYPSLLKKIEKAIGHGTIHPAALEEAVHQVQTKRFMETSPLHRDFYTDEHGVRQGVGENDNGMVGFIFGNTNEDAHFETDDGSLCFPVVEGTFMSFDGMQPHQTVVNSGHVELIGPFLLSSKALFRVGGIPGEPTFSPTGIPTFSPTGIPTFSPTTRPSTLQPTPQSPTPATSMSYSSSMSVSTLTKAKAGKGKAAKNAKV
jgi:hypothetical protein